MVGLRVWELCDAVPMFVSSEQGLAMGTLLISNWGYRQVPWYPAVQEDGGQARAQAGRGGVQEALQRGGGARGREYHRARGCAAAAGRCALPRPLRQGAALVWCRVAPAALVDSAAVGTLPTRSLSMGRLTSDLQDLQCVACRVPISRALAEQEKRTC